jgi:hypothetical protein
MNFRFRVLGRALFTAARRAFVVSALAFSIPHAYRRFCGFLGGFPRLKNQ